MFQIAIATSRVLKDASIAAACRGMATANAVQAIKEIRLIEECGLKEAKEAYDAIRAQVTSGLNRWNEAVRIAPVPPFFNHK